MFQKLTIPKPRSSLPNKIKHKFTKSLALVLSITCAIPTLPTTAYATEAFFNGSSAGTGAVNGGGTWSSDAPN